METEKLKQIALDLKAKIEAGLKEDKQEILCLPTFINPKTTGINGTAVALDLGGTNYRFARIDFENGESTFQPENGWKRDLQEMKTDGYTEEKLHEAQAEPLKDLKLENVNDIPVGYTFSYPGESLPKSKDGSSDAKLVKWTKRVNISEMVGKEVGRSLLDYFEEEKHLKFKNIKVINDTVASLFAGLTKSDFDAHIGLIVGTGTNMAALMQTDKIKKLTAEQKEGMGVSIPINLESGNFHPRFLTIYDEMVDTNSDKPGEQRFEKAISGDYLGEIFKAVYPLDEFEEKFNAESLTTMLNYPARFKDEYVATARWIYERSAQLVAASLAGLILVLKSHKPSIKSVLITAEGSLFWSEILKGKNYSEMVEEKLRCLINDFGYEDVRVEFYSLENANLIGAAIAALS